MSAIASRMEASTATAHALQSCDVDAMAKAE